MSRGRNKGVVDCMGFENLKKDFIRKSVSCNKLIYQDIIIFGIYYVVLILFMETKIRLLRSNFV